MGWLSWLFGSRPGAERWLEPGDSDFDIVGESHYQSALEAIVGGKTDQGAEHECTAMLVPEPGNPHDSNAVRVEIGGRTVGYLSRDKAADYRRYMGTKPTRCEAVIVGGWSRGRRGSGHFGVKLDIDWPPRIVT